MASPIKQNYLTSSCKLPLLVHKLCFIRHCPLMKAYPTMMLHLSSTILVYKLTFLIHKM